MAKGIILMKYTFYVAVICSAGYVIERLSGIQRQWKVDPVVFDDLVYNVSAALMARNYDKVLNKDYSKCFTEPSDPFCLLPANKRHEVFRSKDKYSPTAEDIENRLHNITSDFASLKVRIHTMLAEFTKLMKAYRVNVILMEPSILHCLLSSTAKQDMLEKGFNPGRLLGSRYVVTVGVLNDDSNKLEGKNLTSEILSSGFKVIKIRKSIGDGLKKAFETVHYFFMMEDVAMHVVVFYSKEDFLWHTGLDPKEIDIEGLLFVDEGIYENFTLLPLNLAGSSISRLFIPHDVRQFMREIEFAKVIECRTNTSGGGVNEEHPILTREQMITRTVIVLKELKAIFSPYATTFWLWSKSLLGWFTECDAFHFSWNLNLALPYKHIKGFNLTDLLVDNEYLKVENNTEMNSTYGGKLDCHGLQINLHFIHEDKGFVWHKYSDGEDHVYKYPLFTLCSSEMYGQKIHVPCNITETLDVEFIRNGTLKLL